MKPNQGMRWYQGYCRRFDGQNKYKVFDVRQKSRINPDSSFDILHFLSGRKFLATEMATADLKYFDFIGTSSDLESES